MGDDVSTGPRLALATATLVAVVFLIAGGAKLLNLDAFHDAVRTWSVIPAAAATPISILVPIAEIAVAAAFLLGLDRRRSIMAMGALLVAFSLAMAYQLAVAKPPTCGCFGKLLTFQNDREAAIVSLIRNACLLLLLAGPWVWRATRPASPGRPRAPGPRGMAPRRRQPPARPAFSLIELVLVILLIGILAALTLPALSGARRSATDTASLARMRSLTTAIGAYAGDCDDALPHFTRPNATATVLRGCGEPVTIPYFFATVFWPCVMAPYLDLDPRDQAFRYPRSRGERTWDYLYPQTLYSAPSYWNFDTREGPSQWTTVRQSSVRFPSSKAGVVEWRPDEPLPAPTSSAPAPGFGFLDGGAARFSRSELIDPFPAGDGLTNQAWIGVGIYGLHTVDGVLGRDTTAR